MHVSTIYCGKRHCLKGFVVIQIINTIPVGKRPAINYNLIFLLYFDLNREVRNEIESKLNVNTVML